MIVTAVGESPYDFVSRYFAPAKGIPEDPVTGGAHCMLAPYWGAQLGKTDLRAWQASRRGGEIVCRLGTNGRVELEGQCVFYMEGEVQIQAAQTARRLKCLTPPGQQLIAPWPVPISSRIAPRGSS